MVCATCRDDDGTEQSVDLSYDATRRNDDGMGQSLEELPYGNIMLTDRPSTTTINSKRPDHLIRRHN